MDSTCVICEKNYLYDRKKGHTRNKCGTCMVNIRRFDRKKRCLEYKGGKCEHCGYNKSSSALVFHHRDGTDKDFGVGGNHCRKWETVKAELDKCVLLCANCHAEEHERLILGP